MPKLLSLPKLKARAVVVRAAALDALCLARLAENFLTMGYFHQLATRAKDLLSYLTRRGFTARDRLGLSIMLRKLEGGLANGPHKFASGNL